MSEDKLMELVEDCFKMIKSQNKYIEDLEAKKQEVRYITKTIDNTDETYKENCVKLFVQYNQEIDKLKEENSTLKAELKCLSKGYITSEGEYKQ